MNEIYKDIVGYEGKYQVSNLGNVKSLNYKRSGKEKLLVPYQTANGYMTISLWNNNRGHTEYIHRLVAKAFIDNPDNLPEVNHKDENKQNNSVENLEWCDSKYNMNYGEGAHKKSAENHKKPIYQYDLQGNFIKEWSSATDIHRELGYSNTNIARCCRGVSKTSHGYIWRYKEVV